jgi:membrane protease YdiL (CAAX protease family)
LFQGIRFFLAVISVSIYAYLSKWDLPSLGLGLKPLQGWAYWLKFCGLFSLIIVILSVLDYFFSPGDIKPDKIQNFFTYLFFTFTTDCLITPLLEELIYRFTLCNPLVNLFGQRNTIIISGIFFAALHFVYGNPVLLNCLSGFFFAWTFFKSRTLVIPLLLHSLCNLIIVLSMFAGIYL